MSMPPGAPTHDHPPEAAPARRFSGRMFLRLALGAWTAALLFIALRLWRSSARQSVFAADYAAAGVHWFHGLPLYRGVRHFLYSPLTAAALVPFGLLPSLAGEIAWRLVSAGAFLWASVAWMGTGAAGFGTAPALRRDDGGAATFLLLLLPLAVGNINIGQVNLLVLVAVAGAVLAARRERWSLAALATAAGGFLKIYPLAVGLLLVAVYPRQLLWRLAAAVAGLFALSLVLQHPSYAWEQYRQWIGPLRADDRLEVDLFATWRDFGFLLRACGVEMSPAAYRAMEIAAGAGVAAFCLAGQWLRRWDRDRLLGTVFALGCAWMVLFGPATEAATYVVLAPAVCAALVAAWRSAERWPRVALGAVYVTLLAADLGNSWFRAGASSLWMRALQPLAALGFVVAVVCRAVRAPAAPPRPEEKMRTYFRG